MHVYRKLQNLQVSFIGYMLHIHFWLLVYMASNDVLKLSNNILFLSLSSKSHMQLAIRGLATSVIKFMGYVVASISCKRLTGEPVSTIDFPFPNLKK